MSLPAIKRRGTPNRKDLFTLRQRSTQSTEQTSIDRIFRSYYLPAIEIPELLPKSKNEISNLIKKDVIKANHKSITVLHEQPTYSCVGNSMLVLENNRDIYKKIQGILKEKESEQLLNAFDNCKKEQNQLRLSIRRVRMSCSSSM